MRTNLKSQIAAMRYLAAKKPSVFEFIQSKYQPYKSELGFYLNEKFVQGRSEIKKLVHAIVVKPTHRHWD